MIPEVALVGFTIRDLAGRTVRNWTEQATSPGQHMTAWNGSDNHDRAVPAGVYLCAMKAGDATARARLVLPR